jgi:hypothetical protein
MGKPTFDLKIEIGNQIPKNIIRAFLIAGLVFGVAPKLGGLLVDNVPTAWVWVKNTLLKPLKAHADDRPATFQERWWP